MGHTNIHVFRDGLPGWVAAGYPTVTIEKLPLAKAKSVSTAELKKMIDSGEDFVLLDIRFTDQSRKYKVPAKRQINIPMDELPDQLHKVPTGVKIIIIDEVAKRTPIAARYLALKGFDVTVVEGGIQKWVSSGLPITK